MAWWWQPWKLPIELGFFDHDNGDCRVVHDWLSQSTQSAIPHEVHHKTTQDFWPYGFVYVRLGVALLADVTVIMHPYLKRCVDGGVC